MNLRHLQVLTMFAIDLYVLWHIYQAGVRDERRGRRGR